MTPHHLGEAGSHRPSTKRSKKSQFKPTERWYASRGADDRWERRRTLHPLRVS